MENDEEKITRLLDNIYMTATSRFRASQRLIKEREISSFLIPILSIYVITLSLLPVFGVACEKSNFLNLISVIASIFIIVISIINSLSSNDLDAYLYHENAKKLKKLYNKYDAVKIDSTELVEEYHKLLDNCPNHKPFDTIVAKFGNKDKSVSYYERLEFLLGYFFAYLIYPFILIILLCISYFTLYIL